LSAWKTVEITKGEPYTPACNLFIPHPLSFHSLPNFAMIFMPSPVCEAR